MIAETAVLSSPWGLDSFISRDMKLGGEPDLSMLDVDIAAIEAELDRVHQQKMTDSAAPKKYNKARPIGSCNTSVASSECSDEPFIDFDGEDSLFGMTDDNDYLNNSILNMLGGSEPDHLSLSAFEWTDSEADLPVLPDILSEEVIPSMPSSPQPCRKRCHQDSLSEHKPWSSMSNSEQVSVVEEISRIISEQLGLREQLEVIKIISPASNVSPTDTEFIIDLDSLDDEKLTKVREFVKQHSKNTDVLSHGSSSESCSPTQKKLTKKQKRLQQKELRQRQRKEYRQMMKERRSGLFKKEEVLALKTGADTEDDGDIDVDIV